MVLSAEYGGAGIGGHRLRTVVRTTAEAQCLMVGRGGDAMAARLPRPKPAMAIYQPCAQLLVAVAGHHGAALVHIRTSQRVAAMHLGLPGGSVQRGICATPMRRIVVRSSMGKRQQASAVVYDDRPVGRMPRTGLGSRQLAAHGRQ